MPSAADAVPVLVVAVVPAAFNARIISRGGRAVFKGSSLGSRVQHLEGLVLATPVAFGHAHLCQSEVKPRLPWGPLARVRDTDGPVWKRNAGS